MIRIPIQERPFASVNGDEKVTLYFRNLLLAVIKDLKRFGGESDDVETLNSREPLPTVLQTCIHRQQLYL